MIEMFAVFAKITNASDWAQCLSMESHSRSFFLSLRLFVLPMLNPTEKDEREYLEIMKEKLLLAVRRVDDSVRQYSEELRQNKQYIYEHQSGLDEADMVAAGQFI